MGKFTFCKGYRVEIIGELPRKIFLFVQILNTKSQKIHKNLVPIFERVRAGLPIIKVFCPKRADTRTQIRGAVTPTSIAIIIKTCEIHVNRKNNIIWPFINVKNHKNPFQGSNQENRWIDEIEKDYKQKKPSFLMAFFVGSPQWAILEPILGWVACLCSS